jgi:hypothetical protein
MLGYDGLDFQFYHLFCLKGIMIYNCTAARTFFLLVVYNTFRILKQNRNAARVALLPAGFSV